MSPLREVLADYLSVRRALGFKLDRAEKLIGQFMVYLEEQSGRRDHDRARGGLGDRPAGAPWWYALRL